MNNCDTSITEFNVLVDIFKALCTFHSIDEHIVCLKFIANMYMMKPLHTYEALQ